MKHIRAYHSKIKIHEGWPLSSKKSCIEILDDKNNFVFSITFGKVPKIEVFKVDNGGIGNYCVDKLLLNVNIK